MNWTSREDSRAGYAAGICWSGKDVVLTGNITRIEIWSKTKWMENSSYDDMDAIAEGMQDMGIVI